MRHLKHVTLGALLMATALLPTRAQQVVDISTGRLNGTNLNIGLGGYDDTWTVQTPNNGTVTPRVAQISGSWAESNCSRWISTQVTSTHHPIADDEGNYRFNTRFNIAQGCGTRVRTASVTFERLGADNNIIGFELNGHSYTLNPPASNDFNPLTGPITIALTAGHFVSGANTATLIVNNAQYPMPTYVGLNVCGSISIDYLPGSANLTPTITGPSSFCAGAPVTVTGADGSASNADFYLWESVECDWQGTPIAGAANNFSNWYAGSPGNFTFAANLFTCGKFYRIRLAASNSCTVWSETSKVVYIACPPTIDAGKNKFVCNDDCVLIGPPATTHMTYAWTYTYNGVTYPVGNSSQIMVCPGQTTTYTLTATNGYGCSSTDQVTVAVIPNRSDFSSYVNTSNPNYYTVTCTPNDVNGYSQPGFNLHWAIEELNGSSSYYYNAYSNCWWTYPAQKFQGFVSLSNHSYTQNTACGSPVSPTEPDGRFLYNRNYRITLATWNDYCPWEQTSFLFTQPKSLNGTQQQVVFYEDTNAPDLSFMKEQLMAMAQSPAQEVLPMVYPNPSNGHFTLSLGEPTGADVEVFDLMGKKLHSFTLPAGSTAYEVDLSGFARGIYILNITAAGNRYSQKLILE